MAVNFYTDINADSFVKEGGTSSQYLMADGSTTTSSGGSSPWTTDTNGITYTAGGVGIGAAFGEVFPDPTPTEPLLTVIMWLTPCS